MSAESPLDAYLKQNSALGVRPPYWALDLMRECTRLAVAARNHRAMLHNGDAKTTMVAPLAKSVAGLGPVPEFAATPYAWRHGDPGAEIGADPRQFGLATPVTKAEVERLTTPQIADLCVFYNDHFGIVRRDTIRDQRRKLARFLGVPYAHP